MGEWKLEMNALIKEILNNNSLDIFYEMLWTNKKFSEVFFLHKEDLFPMEYNFCVDTLVFQSDTEELDITDYSLNKKEYNDIQKDDQKSKFYTLKTLIYNNNFPLILELIFEYFKGIEPLRKYFCDEIELKELIGRTKSYLIDVLDQNDLFKAQSSSDFEKEMYENIYKGFSKNNFTLGNFASSNLKMGFIYLYRFLFNYPNFPYHLLDLIEIKKEDYEIILEKLQDLDLIESQFTYSICQLCKYNDFQYFVSLSDIYIRELKSTKIICPQCGELMTIRSLLFLHPLISKIIVYYPDGLLTVALAWYFEKNNIKWEHSIYGENSTREKDFIITTSKGKNILLECKVIKRKENENSMKIVFKEAIKQINEQLIDLRKSEKRIDCCLIVFNLDLNLYKKIKKEILNEIQIENLDIIGYNNLQKRLKNF